MIVSPPHLLDGRRWAGMRVGLLGGSFNPPHEGHVHISLMALRGLKLDYVWWLVTPQNPLKEGRVLAPYEERLALSRKYADNPGILVTDIENRLGINKSYDTVKALNCHFPATRFVWITGMDNALAFHKWHRWRDILDLVATAHIARPPAWSLIENCPLRLMASQRHICVERPFRALLVPRHTYWLLRKKMMPVSSTEIRKALSESLQGEDKNLPFVAEKRKKA